MAARKKTLGDAYVEKAIGSANTFNVEFQRLVTEYCWGHVWNQPTLSDKQRSLNNVCMLAALGKTDEFKLHFAGAIRNGCTVAELKETLMQVTIYCGVPTGVMFFKIAGTVLDEMGVVPEKADFHG